MCFSLSAESTGISSSDSILPLCNIQVNLIRKSAMSGFFACNNPLAGEGGVLFLLPSANYPTAEHSMAVSSDG